MSDDRPDLDPTELPSTEAAPSSSENGQQIGPYRLLQKLGEGGMGEVWLAEQSVPVKRRVALKIIKQGMDTKRVVARFEAERQALAMMDHPAVAKVFDAGTTSRGRPYFVMEYAKGVPITEHCDRHKLTNRERLELFLQVCEGVQHAHQKAIIHRDLKPSNVLVMEQDGKRLPKIIDFGVAKATAHKLTEKTMFTELGVLIGTPEYMSPEQAELTGEDVDTRTDVYSLGVILYELLVGALPFDPQELRSGGFDGIRKKIREEEPHRPSTRLSTLGDGSTESATCRSVDLSTLQRQLEGDLDWITMKALEKDRARRYGSPNELAADVGRYLSHEPVLASPPSAVYRAKKFVRRHRFGVLAAAAGVIVLVGFALTMAVQAQRIAAERDRANAEAERANREAEAKGQVSGFLQSLFAVSDPGEARGNSITARELLDKGAREIQQLDNEETRAELMATIGDVYWKLGLHEQAKPLLQQALAERERIFGDEHPATLASTNALANLYQSQGQNDVAEPLHLRNLEIRERLYGRDNVGTLVSLNNLALLYQAEGRFEEAEQLHLEIMERVKRVLGDEHEYVFSSMDHLAEVYKAQGRHEEAEPLYHAAIEGQTRVLGRDHWRTLEFIEHLANFLKGRRRYAEAEPLHVEVLETRRRVFGDEHPATFDAMNNLANLYRSQGRLEEAEALHLETLEARRRVLGDEHPRTLRSMANLALVHRSQGRLEEAAALHLETLELRERVLGEEHPDTRGSLSGLANVYRDQGRFELADDLLLRKIEIERRVGEEKRALGSMKSLARSYRGRERYAEAGALYRDILDTERRVLGEESPATLRAMRDLGTSLAEHGRFAECEALTGEFLGISRRVLGEDHAHTLDARDTLAACIGAQGRLDEAESLMLATLEAKSAALGAVHPATAATLYNLACVEGRRGNPANGLAWLRRSVDAGWTDVDLMTRDADIHCMHGPEFDALVERARQNAVAEQGE